jgi:hypothetical protein
MGKPEDKPAANHRKIPQVFHRGTPEMIALLEKLVAAIKRETGIEVSRAKVVELAIRELAKKRKITA